MKLQEDDGRLDDDNRLLVKHFGVITYKVATNLTLIEKLTS